MSARNGRGTAQPPLARRQRSARLRHRSRCARAAKTPATSRQAGDRHRQHLGSDINFCHTHLRARAEDVKRGVLQAGGFPVELPAMSLSEPFVKPSTMLYRNLLAMETEELLRSHPIDGAVRWAAATKTTPA